MRGFLPKCIWNGGMFNWLRGVCLIVLISLWTLSSNVIPSAKFALVNDLIVRIVRSTKPLPVCRFGVHHICLIFSPSQRFLNSSFSKQLSLSVRIHRGVPMTVKDFVRNSRTVRVSLFSAVGQLPKRSIATKMYKSPRVYDFIGPAKSNWISRFGSVKTSSLFSSADGICVLMFLQAALHLGHVSAFFWIFRYNPGHQKASVSSSIFTVDVWPWCSMAMIVVLMFSGITILSLQNNKPNLVVRCNQWGR